MDLAYALAALLTLPFWIVRMLSTGKHRTDWPGRWGRGPSLPRSATPRVLIHAVSVGEVNSVEQLVRRLALGPDSIESVLSVTTDTGVQRAESLYAGLCPVIRFPFDASFAMSRMLDRVRPDAIVLTELEVWPNLTRLCRARCIPVCIVNGRLSQRSLRRYRLIRPIVRSLFRRLAFIAAQDHIYAHRFMSLGLDPSRIHVTGTMKWDTGRVEGLDASAASLASELGIDRSRPLIVAGSTAPDEHAMLHAAVPPGVQLLCAPRKPEWFDHAAATMPGCARRSTRLPAPPGCDRFLLDSLGELRLAYSLADIAIVGRTFGGMLHGSDMMEPVSLGKPTIVGPDTRDFEHAMHLLTQADAVLQVTSAALPNAIRTLLDNPQQRAALAANGLRVVQAQRGATERNANLIRSLIQHRSLTPSH